MARFSNRPYHVEMLRLSSAVETFPIAGRFVIARGAKTEARVVVVTLGDGSATGRGECVPYARYGETVEGVIAAIERVAPAVIREPARLPGLLPPGAARNAIDCALWDLEAKRSGLRAFARAGIVPAVATTAFTISVGPPGAMAEAARAAARPLLKIKLRVEENRHVHRQRRVALHHRVPLRPRPVDRLNLRPTTGRHGAARAGKHLKLALLD